MFQAYIPLDVIVFALGAPDALDLALGIFIKKISQ